LYACDWRYHGCKHTYCCFKKERFGWQQMFAAIAA